MTPFCAILPLVLAAAGRPPRTIVLGIKAEEGVRPEVAQLLTDELVARVQRLAAGHRVLGPSDLDELLGLEARRARFGAADAKQLTRTGRALGADELITGTLGRLGRTYLLTLSRFDVHALAIRKERSVALDRPRPPDLIAAVDELAPALFGPGSDDGVGTKLGPSPADPGLFPPPVYGEPPPEYANPG